MGHSLAERTTRFSAPIDIAILSKNTAGNHALEREVLHLFGASCEDYLRALEDAPNDASWHLAAHTLKGAAQSVGATAVANLAAEAELMSAREGRARIIGPIARALTDAKRFIDFRLLDAAH